MLKSVVIAAALLAAPFSVNAQTYESETERLVVECKGYLDKIVVYIETSMVPGDTSTAVTSVELGVILKQWEPKKFEYEIYPEVTGAYASLEGSAGGGIGAYTLTFPEIGWATAKQQTTNFISSLTLKGGLVKGKTSVNCKASLRKIKSRSEYQ